MRERSCNDCGLRYPTVEVAADDRLAPCPMCGPAPHGDPLKVPRVLCDGVTFGVQCPTCGTLGPRDPCEPTARSKWATRTTG